jgi:Phage major capsid protein E
MPTSTVVIDPFKARELDRLVEKIKRPIPYFQGQFFKNKRMHASKRIDYEVYNNSDGIAKFVFGSETHEIKKGEKKVLSHTLPKTSESKTYEAEEMADWQALGNMYGTPADSALEQNKITTRELMDLKDRVIRLREFMSVMALTKGSWTITIGNKTFSFGYPGIVTNTIANGGHIINANTEGWGYWDATAPDIAKCIRKMKKTIMKRYGIAPNTLILGDAAAEAFIEDEALMKKLDTLNYKVGVIDLNKNAESEVVDKMGKVFGLDVSNYSQLYTDKAGAVQEMYDPKMITMGITNPVTNAIAIGTILGVVIALFVFLREIKKDNRKSNRELITDALASQKEISGIKSDVDLLKQKMDTYEKKSDKLENDLKADINEIKASIISIYNKIDDVTRKT